MGIETCGEVNVMASTWPLCTKARTLIFLIHNVYNHLRHTTPTSAHKQKKTNFIPSLLIDLLIKLIVLRQKHVFQVAHYRFQYETCWVVVGSMLHLLWFLLSSLCCRPLCASLLLLVCLLSLFFSSVCAFDVGSSPRGTASPGSLN